MRNLPVHWSEGMFLRPHHLQAADRHWAELIQTSEQYDHPYHYGLRRLEYSKEALLNSQFQINACEARLKDGTLVSLGAFEEPDRVDLRKALQEVDEHLGQKSVGLREAFDIEPKVRVYLAVPKLKLGSANVALSGENGDDPCRYQETQVALQDESRGGNDQEVRFRSLNVRLLLSTEPRTGYELLPIAEIERAGASGATPQVTSYIPPLLAIDAWPPLARDFVRAIYDMVGNRLQVLTEQVQSRGLTFASQEPNDLNRIWMLAQLNEAYATLGVLTFSRGVHPFDAYLELCRLIGKLSIFGPDHRLADVPPYDHDELEPIFAWLKKQIDMLLHSGKEDRYELRYFFRIARGMQVSLDAKWLNPDWQWYVGVSSGNLSDTECRELVSPGQLNWKLGSRDRIDKIFERAEPGLALLPLDRTPPALPLKGWLYFEVTRSNEAWRDVQRTQSLAMRFTENLVYNDKESDDKTLIVNFRAKRVKLQFGLFAVPLNT